MRKIKQFLLTLLENTKEKIGLTIIFVYLYLCLWQYCFRHQDIKEKSGLAIILAGSSNRTPTSSLSEM